MPKRTNEFQKLVFLLKRHVASGATVTESKMLPDLVSGKEREVDVVIEASVGGHSVCVSIECTEAGRPPDIGWVEKMKAKHDRLPTNVLVLASKSGLTGDALELAQSYGIQLISFEALNENSVESLFGATGSLWSKIFTLTPSNFVITVKVGEAEENCSALPDNLLYTEDGTEVAQVKDLAEHILRSKYIFEDILRQGLIEHKWFEVGWEPPASAIKLYLKSIVPDELRIVVRAKVAGPCTFEVSEFRLRKGVIDNVKIAWGLGVVREKSTLLFASEDGEGNKMLSLCDAVPSASTECPTKLPES
jgi:hypothetical protein